MSADAHRTGQRGLGDRISAIRRRPLAIAGALVADRVVGEPPEQVHPVVWFGRLTSALEDRWFRDRRSAGALHASAGTLLGIAAGGVVRSTAAALTVTIAAKELEMAARRVEDALRLDDLATARQEIRALVGRDVTTLDESGLAAAVIESLAENSVDAVVSPICWAWVGGAPGAGAHRAINTLDAMVGHKSSRYLNFGWASARLDDVANFVPARLFALLVAAGSPSRARHVAGAIRRDAGAHPSPNAGVAEAAVAGALGVELGGPLRYGDVVDQRPTLGSGGRPGVDDIDRAIRLVRRTQIIVGAAALAQALWPAARGSAAAIGSTRWVLNPRRRRST